ncbi:MAG: acyl carrier protein [bacterium]|nr:acyl carrier protein [bacterium]
MAPTMEEIQALVRVQLGKRNVAAEDRFMEDLGAESADVVNIVATVEDTFLVSFDDVDIAALRTVRDIYDQTKTLLK